VEFSAAPERPGLVRKAVLLESGIVLYNIAGGLALVVAGPAVRRWTKFFGRGPR